MRIVYIAIIGACILGMLILVPVALAMSQMKSGDSCVPTSQEAGASTGDDKKVNGVPAKFIPLYQEAAAKFNLGSEGPSMLAGVHYKETSFSTNIAKSGPYVGPMAHGTAFWDTYGQDGDGDGKKDIMNDADAIYAAAGVLKEHGAPKDWRDALASYNAGAANKSAGYGYANDVMKFAKEHRIPATGGGDSEGSSAEDCEPADGEGGGGGEVSESGKALREAFLKQKNITYQKAVIQDEIRDGGVVENVLKAVLAAARSKGIGNIAISAAGCRSHSNSGGLHCPTTPSQALDIGSVGTDNPSKVGQFLCNSFKRGNPYKIEQLGGIVGSSNCYIMGGKAGAAPYDGNDHIHVGTSK